MRSFLFVALASGAAAFATPPGGLVSPAVRPASSAAHAAPSMALSADARSRFESLKARLVCGARSECAVGASRAAGVAARVSRWRKGAFGAAVVRLFRRLARSLVWGAVVLPVAANAHPALAYVGYGREEVDVLRQESGSMGLVIPVSVVGIALTTMRQGARSKKEIKRIKRAYKKVKEEEAEYMDVDGKAESDADIMASLRNRTDTLDVDEANAAVEETKANAPPPPPSDAPPPPKKRMTMMEKVAAKQAQIKAEEDKKKKE
jgi:hypothetical protein